MSHKKSVTIHPDIDRVLIDEPSLQRRIVELGAQISADYAGEDIVLAGVLKGAVLFMADLARAITVPLSFDFMAVSSYGDTMHSKGLVRILKDLDDPIAGRHVLLVEDIIDTGLTLSYVLEHLRQSQPASLGICALLEKSRERVRHVEPNYVGFTVPDEFVVGYGLDYAQHYRNLPYIGVLRPEVYADAEE
jgi:hypoxanthine phosphoribosyltransferase